MRLRLLVGSLVLAIGGLVAADALGQAARWAGPPAVDVVAPWTDARPARVAVEAPLVDPWRGEPHRRPPPPRLAIVDPWQRRVPTAVFPDVDARDPWLRSSGEAGNGLVDPWAREKPHVVPVARFPAVGLVDPWASRR